MSKTDSRIDLVQGDITKLKVDAVVNAANSALCGGGGVDGAIHAAAGTKLVAASMQLAPCPAGECRVTDSFDLPGRFVIHAVGPVFSSLHKDGPVLEQTYRSALSEAANQKVDSLAFPCISTGAYGFPREPACEIAIQTVVSWIRKFEFPKKIIFCCYQTPDFELYSARLDELGFNSAGKEN